MAFALVLTKLEKKELEQTFNNNRIATNGNKDQAREYIDSLNE